MASLLPGGRSRAWCAVSDPSSSPAHGASVVGVLHRSNKAGLERGTRATLLQLSGNLVHTMSTLPDVHKAKESLVSTGMFYAVLFLSVWLNCRVIIL